MYDLNMFQINLIHGNWSIAKGELVCKTMQPSFKVPYKLDQAYPM